MALSFAKRWFDRFVPLPIVAQGPDAVRRARLIVYFSHISAAFCAVAGTLHAVKGSPIIAAIAYGSFVLLAPVSELLRRTGRPALAGNLLVAVWFATIAVFTVVRGGLGEPAAGLNCVVPLLAIAVAGRRAGLVWLGLVMGELAILLVVKLTIGELPDLAPIARAPAVQAIAFAAFFATLFAIAWSYEVLKEGAIAAVLRSRFRARSLLTAVPDTILRVDRSMHLLDSNTGRTDLTSHPVHVATEVGVQLADMLEVHVEACLNEAEPWQGTMSFGSLRLDVRMVPSGPNEVTIIIRDQTEQYAIADELEEVAHKHEVDAQRLSLLRTNRMAEVGMLAASVAHEINNPLAYVMSHLEQLEKTSQGEDKKLIAEALDGTKRIGEIVRDIRLFSRVDDSEPDRPLRVGEVVSSALSIARNDLRHRAEVDLDIEGEPWVVAHPSRLAQVLINLLNNAGQAVDGLGKGHVRVRVWQSEGEVSIAVEDDGVGIDLETQNQIFEPFFTTKDRTDGTGLGLWICRDIIDKLGGRIELDSEVGRGSTFTVVLPAAAPEALPAPPSSKPTRLAAPRVLIVDDEPLVARAVARALEDCDISVATTTNAAKDSIGDELPDVVLCDVMMPDGGGLELHQWLGDHAPALQRRLILITGGVFNPRVQSALDEIDCQCLEKPIDRALLREAVASAVPQRTPMALHGEQDRVF